MKLTPKHRKAWKLTFFGGNDQGNKLQNFQESHSIYPLTHASVNSKVKIVEIQNPQDVVYFSNLGLIPGVHLQILNNQGNGSVMVTVQDQSIALGSAIAREIIVTDKLNY